MRRSFSTRCAATEAFFSRLPRQAYSSDKFQPRVAAIYEIYALRYGFITIVNVGVKCFTGCERGREVFHSVSSVIHSVKFYTLPVCVWVRDVSEAEPA